MRVTMPNMLTSVRIILAPFVYNSGLAQDKKLFVLLFLIGGLTDAADGLLARLTNTVSAWGSKFDTVADLLFYPAGLMVYFFVPEVVTDNMLIIGCIVGVFLASVFIDVVRGRFGMPHLLSAKVTGVCIYVFVLYTLLVEYVPLLFYALAIVGTWAAVEQLMVSLRGVHS